MTRRPPNSTLSPHTPLSRSHRGHGVHERQRAPPPAARDVDEVEEGIQLVGDVVPLALEPALVLVAHVGVRLERDQRRSEEHTSELQSQSNLVCRLLLEKKKH